MLREYIISEAINSLKIPTTRSLAVVKTGEKVVRENLLEATEASKTNLQYIRAKTASNNHFEARRYIAKEILKDTNLAAAYTSLEMIHDRYARVIGNDAITIRQRLERMMMADLKRKVKNWDEIYSAL